MADHAPDPGGIFASDVHRRVLAHLSRPDDEIAWSPVALVLRVASDPAVPFPPAGEYGLGDVSAGVEGIETVLAELKDDGLAKTPAKGVWQMTKKGFDLLTGPIANEPDVGATPTGPAVIGPTPLGSRS